MRHVVWWKLTDVSGVLTASVMRATTRRSIPAHSLHTRYSRDAMTTEAPNAFTGGSNEKQFTARVLPGTLRPHRRSVPDVFTTCCWFHFCVFAFLEQRHHALSFPAVVCWLPNVRAVVPFWRRETCSVAPPDGHFAVIAATFRSKCRCYGGDLREVDRLFCKRFSMEYAGRGLHFFIGVNSSFIKSESIVTLFLWSHSYIQNTSVLYILVYCNTVFCPAVVLPIVHAGISGVFARFLKCTLLLTSPWAFWFRHTVHKRTCNETVYSCSEPWPRLLLSYVLRVPFSDSAVAWWHILSAQTTGFFRFSQQWRHWCLSCAL
jgi:hypothetical protein